MSDAAVFLRANPVIVAILGGVAITVFVLGVCAFLMARAGLSLKPVGFMAVFMTIVAGPQVAFHVAQVAGWVPTRDLAWIPASSRAPAYGYVEREDALAASDGRFADPDVVFGADHDPDLLTDMRGSSGPFAGTEVAQMAVLRTGGTSIVARYPDRAAAERGAEAFLVAAVSGVPARSGDGTWTFERPAGDAVKALVAGRTLVVLTGPDARSLEDRLSALAIVSVASSDPSVPAGAGAADFWLYRPGVLAALTAGLLVISVLWFFKGSAWATTIDAAAGVAPVTEQELERRLMAVNDLDVPFSVDRVGPSWLHWLTS